ncbi:hypothetical protein [Pyrobaculum aerophilum]|uniref:hypothetical protein n=1 Tax=Pyrobaculum aerophilum TaxID=13773 RepID=UPI002FDA5F58
MSRTKALLLALAIPAWAFAASEAVALYLDGVIDGTAVTLASAALGEAQRLDLPW